MISDNQSSTFYSQIVMGRHENTAPVIHQAQARRVRPVHSSLGSTSRLLNIGSGAGVGADLIAKVANIGHVTCIDISIPALADVCRRGLSSIVASAEGHKLPFPNGTFDIVILDEVIEHLVDTDSIMDEIHRVLRNDGQLLISTPNLASWFNRLALLFGVQPAFSEVSFRKIFGRPGSGIVGHLRLFTRRTLIQFVHHNGFNVRHAVGVPFPELPFALRGIDRLMAKVPSIAGGSVIVADRRS